jgi:hypothetical protein
VIEHYVPEVNDPCAGGETVQVQVGWYELAAGGQRRPRLEAPGDMALAGTMTLPVSSVAPAAIAPANHTDLRLVADLALVGYTIHSTDLQPAAPLVADLYWQNNAQMNPYPMFPQYSLSLRLAHEEHEYNLWRGNLTEAEWPAEEVLCRRVRARLPAQLEPGVYQLVIVFGDVKLPFHQLTVGASTRKFAVPRLATTVDATLGNAVKLLGYDLTQPTAMPNTLAVMVVWQAVTVPEQSYTAFVHLLDESGAIVAQSDALPAEGYTTDRWIAGEVVSDTHQLSLPAEVQPGRYHLVAGLYDAASGARLPVYDSNKQPLADGAVTLGEVQLPLAR